jgi:branched-chain amino acid transport system ATP-binding protein
VSATAAGGGSTAATAVAPLLEIEDVSSGYGDLQVLWGISLMLRPGMIEVVLGRNGVGKTTLLSTISGLVPVWDGKLRLRGEDISRRPAYRRARSGIALVQEGKRVFRNLTVTQNVALGTYGQKMSRRDRAARVVEILAQFPMIDSMHERRAADLSGGQQQMLAIAQALAAEPDVLLLDEPSAGLAPVVAAEVFQQIHRLRDAGMTILLVEQMAELALDIADHVTIVDAGRVLDSGAAERFSNRADLQESYFGGASAAE